MVVRNERKRYILLSFYGDLPDLATLNKKIRKKVSELKGEIFLADSGLYLFKHKDHFVIRCNHISRFTVEAAIYSVKLSSHVKILRISGTIKGLGKEFESAIDPSDSEDFVQFEE